MLAGASWLMVIYMQPVTNASSIHCRRIRPEILEHRCLALDLGERACDVGLARVALDVDIEHVFPESRASGPRLEPGHAHGVLRERREQLVYRAGHVARREDERGL